MSYQLKNIYNETFYERLYPIFYDCIPDFNHTLFHQRIFTKSFHTYELKERLHHTTGVLHTTLPKEFDHAVEIIRKIIVQLQQHRINETHMEFMFFPDYIEQYGQDHYTTSINAMEFITQFSSCEFAVRPFLIQYPQMHEQMIIWTQHHHHKVRRLASEGCRPRLPWSTHLTHYKENPHSIIEILTHLKQDPSEVVRRSVANNLNDISKDHPDLILDLIKKWLGEDTKTDKLLKHACRTLLKQSNLNAMALFGFDPKEVYIQHFTLSNTNLCVGEYLDFSFSLINKSIDKKLVRIEYAIYYRKKNGSHTKKIFKITERKLKPYQETHLQRHHPFKPMTTRRFYNGEQFISIIINGKESDKKSFIL